MEKLSFKTLHDCYAVVIPMLQRDYAYGRIDESEKRDSFLYNLRSYFKTSDPHELDFIYGSVDSNNNLKLLDGQQRITVLTNVFSNIIFEQCSKLTDLISPSLKRRFFLSLPKWKYLYNNPDVNDILGIRNFSDPQNEYDNIFW